MMTRLAVFALLLSTSLFTYAQSKTTTYTYDSLGRLTFVTDSINGNRDYDYDKAGNRTLVAVNTATDSAAEPTRPNPPAAPTGLTCSSVAAGVWRGSWQPVSGAHHYIYRVANLEPTSEFTLSGTSIDKSSMCNWVQACTATNECSTKVFFNSPPASSRAAASSRASYAAASSTPPAPPAPTGLSCSQVAPGVWRGSWQPVVGAHHYIYRISSFEAPNEFTLTGTSLDKRSTCTWVQACNATNQCSTKIYF